MARMRFHGRSSAPSRRCSRSTGGLSQANVSLMKAASFSACQLPCGKGPSTFSRSRQAIPSAKEFRVECISDWRTNRSKRGVRCVKKTHKLTKGRIALKIGKRTNPTENGMTKTTKTRGTGSTTNCGNSPALRKYRRSAWGQSGVQRKALNPSDTGLPVISSRAHRATRLQP